MQLKFKKGIDTIIIRIDSNKDLHLKVNEKSFIPFKMLKEVETDKNKKNEWDVFIKKAASFNEIDDLKAYIIKDFVQDFSGYTYVSE
jgi:hypothetical protein